VDKDLYLKVFSHVILLDSNNFSHCYYAYLKNKLKLSQFLAGGRFWFYSRAGYKLLRLRSLLQKVLVEETLVLSI